MRGQRKSAGVQKYVEIDAIVGDFRLSQSHYNIFLYTSYLSKLTYSGWEQSALRTSILVLQVKIHQLEKWKLVISDKQKNERVQKRETDLICCTSSESDVEDLVDVNDDDDLLPHLWGLTLPGHPMGQGGQPDCDCTHANDKSRTNKPPSIVTVAILSLYQRMIFISRIQEEIKK